MQLSEFPNPDYVLSYQQWEKTQMRGKNQKKYFLLYHKTV